MTLYEVTLWPNNQPPILLGYYKAENVSGAKRKAVKEMTDQGCSLRTDDDNLSAVPKSKNTSYQRWQNPPLSPKMNDLVNRIKRENKRS